VNEDVFDGESRDLGHEDAAEGIGDRGVEADQRERGFVRVIAVVLDLEVLLRAVRMVRFLKSIWIVTNSYTLEAVQRPCVRLSGPMTGEVCGGDVGDSFCVDADDLGTVSDERSEKAI
jgi:hypothetical protein